MTAVQAALCV